MIGHGMQKEASALANRSHVSVLGDFAEADDADTDPVFNIFQSTVVLLE